MWPNLDEVEIRVDLATGAISMVVALDDAPEGAERAELVLESVTADEPFAPQE